MSSVYFDPAVGGDGSTVTDDANATTGLANGGFWTRLVPMFTQVIAVANFAKQKASEALGYKNSASDSASTATNASGNSQQYALNSLNSSTQSQTYRNQAEQFAISAQQSADAAAAISGIPTISGVADSGKVMTVNAAGTAYELKTIPAPKSPDFFIVLGM